ncbi:MAG: hypothetical protein N2504_05735 [candidate division WOR-3 bacterium]|nr:hypothetical protein [candidate division WOR-3 bacterium]MCX7948071.1 hypothetical protein [candidate division WOR-3 bacterium]MDW8150991.1 hypothetical protein [candidate division WOR-3 bacterium]
MLIFILSQSEILYNIQIISSYDKNKEVSLRTPFSINKASVDRRVYYRIDTTVNSLENIDILIFDKKTKKEKIIPLPKFLEPKYLDISLGETLKVSFNFLGFPISEFEFPRVYIISDQGESEAFLLQQDPYNKEVLVRKLEPIDEIGNYKLALVINHPRQLIEIRIYRILNVVYKPIYKLFEMSYGFSGQAAYLCLQILNKLPNTISEEYNVLILDASNIPISMKLRNYGNYSCGIFTPNSAGNYTAKLEGRYKGVISSKVVEFNIIDSINFEIPIKFVGFELKKNKGFIKLENMSNRPIVLSIEAVEAPPEINFNISGSYTISKNTIIPFEYKFLKKVKKNSNHYIRIKFRDENNRPFFLDIKLSVL